MEYTTINRERDGKFCNELLSHTVFVMNDDVVLALHTCFPVNIHTRKKYFMSLTVNMKYAKKKRLKTVYYGKNSLIFFKMDIRKSVRIKMKRNDTRKNIRSNRGRRMLMRKKSNVRKQMMSVGFSCRCAQCFRAFPDDIFYEFEGRKYCEHDFQVLFAPCCAKCSE